MRLQLHLCITAPEIWAVEDATSAKMAALKRKKSICVQLQNGDVINVESKQLA